MSRRLMASNSFTRHMIPRKAQYIVSSPSYMLPLYTPKCTFGLRYSSHSPLGLSPPSRKKITINTLQQMYQRQEPLAMITAHDFPSAHVADHAGMEIILVGDSLAMVALGMKDTSEVQLDDMILHCRSVARATEAAFLVSDDPDPSLS